jgi:hypothetical protein
LHCLPICSVIIFMLVYCRINPNFTVHIIILNELNFIRQRQIYPTYLRFTAFPVGASEAMNKWIKFEREKDMLLRGIEPRASLMSVFRFTDWTIQRLLFIVLCLNVGSSNVLLACRQPCMHNWNVPSASV